MLSLELKRSQRPSNLEMEIRSKLKLSVKMDFLKPTASNLNF